MTNSPDMKKRPYILMLEDDADDRHITESVITDHYPGVDILFVTGPAELIEKLNQIAMHHLDMPHLVIIDKYTHTGNSIDALRFIKKHPQFSGIPVVVVSGSDLKRDINECYNNGANSYIVKPDKSEDTIRKISIFLKYWFEVAELPHPEHARSTPLAWL